MMRRSTILFAAVLFALTAIAVFAADVTGAWTGQMGGPNADGFSVSFAFTQDGAKLTGKVTGPEGQPFEITDGKVEGDKISFSVTFNGMTIKHEGTISGDEIKLSAKSDQREMPSGVITLRRAK